MAALGSKGIGTNNPLNYERILYVAVMPQLAGNAISGTVTDATGTGIVRTVRAYLRSTGMFISEGQSDSNGDFAINGVAAQEHDVVMLDDAAGNTENDQVVRTITD